MSLFTLKLQHPDHGDVEFFVNRIYTVDGMKFFISCFDRSSRSHLFSMRRQEEKWIIETDQEDHPFRPYETMLSDAIRASFKNSGVK